MENRKKALVTLLPMFAILLTVGAITQFSTEQFSETNVIDKSHMTGYVILQVFDKETGLLKYEMSNSNLIVDVGLDEEAQAIFGAGGVGSTFFNFLEIGTTNTAPAPSDTALASSACARIQDLAPDVNTVVSGQTSISVISQFDGALCAGGIVEAGIFNGLAGGEMLARSVFGIVTIGASDLLNVNYTVTLT